MNDVDRRSRVVEYDKDLNGDGVIGMEKNFMGLTGTPGSPATEHVQWFYIKSKPHSSGSLTVKSQFDPMGTRGVKYLNGVTWNIDLKQKSRPDNEEEWHNLAEVNKIDKQQFTNPDFEVQRINGKRPTDPDNDGLYEDLNGNRRIDSDDAVTFFQHKNDDVITDHVDKYDFNGNGRIDFDDVAALFKDL